MSHNRRIAVSDSSPLILYAAIGRFHLLNAVFDEILIPPAVWDEVVNEGAGRPGSHELQSANWIQLRTPSLSLTRIQVGLDRGEMEAISLALEFNRQYRIILDDLAARRYAEAQGLRVIGSAGLLIRLKRRQVIPLVHPVLVELQGAGLRLGDALIKRLLASVGEDT